MPSSASTEVAMAETMTSRMWLRGGAKEKEFFQGRRNTLASRKSRDHVLTFPIHSRYTDSLLVFVHLLWPQGCTNLTSRISCRISLGADDRQDSLSLELGKELSRTVARMFMA